MSFKKSKKKKKNKISGVKRIHQQKPLKSKRLNTIQLLLDEATKHQQTKQYRLAEKKLRQVLSIDPLNISALFNLAIIAHQAKRINEAILLIKKAIQLKPDFFTAYNSLGILYYERQEEAKAEECYIKSIQIQSNNPEAFYNLGILYYERGDFKAATGYFREAIMKKSNFLQAIINLGISLQKLGDLDEAILYLKEALSLSPESPFILNNLGNVLAEKGELNAAEESYQKALTIEPNNVETFFNLGLTYKTKGLFRDAAHCFRKVIDLLPEFAEAYTNLGQVLEGGGDWEEAFKLYKKALAIKPDCYAATHNLGVYYQRKGRLEDALHYLNQTLTISPEWIPTHVAISQIKKYVPGDKHLTEMERLFSINCNDTDKGILAFCLAKAYGDLEEYDESFKYMFEGNKLARSTFNYSSEESKNLYEKIKDIFKKNKFQPIVSNKFLQPTPIFILGMPRSGTSLVEQILASHDDVFGAGEIDCFTKSLYKLTNTSSFDDTIEALSKNFNLDKMDVVGKYYINDITRLSGGEKFITDKMPQNFLVVGFILSSLPNAKIIHCTRDPMDTCFSIYKNKFGGTHKYAYDQDELGNYYLLYRDLMDFWRLYFPQSIYDISYENLVNNQVDETKKLLEMVGLDWDEKCLSFYETQRTVTTASLVQVRKPIYQDSVQLWKQYEKHLQTLKNVLTKKC